MTLHEISDVTRCKTSYKLDCWNLSRLTDSDCMVTVINMIGQRIRIQWRWRPGDVIDDIPASMSKKPLSFVDRQTTWKCLYLVFVNSEEADSSQLQKATFSRIDHRILIPVEILLNFSKLRASTLAMNPRQAKVFARFSNWGMEKCAMEPTAAGFWSI